jgi:nucleotide-binding universal stress UspA family protein
MEKILVGMNPESASYWAGMHALNLAKRINAKVFFLRVTKSEMKDMALSSVNNDREISTRARLEPLIEKARSEGTPVDYYIIYGEYEKELINFIHENKITMLILGDPADHEADRADFTAFLEKIRHRVDCCIEIVHEKNLTG